MEWARMWVPLCPGASIFLKIWFGFFGQLLPPAAFCVRGWSSRREGAPLSKSLIADGLVDSPHITCTSGLQVFGKESLLQNTWSRNCEEDGLGGQSRFCTRTRRQATWEEVVNLSVPCNEKIKLCDFPMDNFHCLYRCCPHSIWTSPKLVSSGKVESVQGSVFLLFPGGTDDVLDLTEIENLRRPDRKHWCLKFNILCLTLSYILESRR